MTSTSLIALRDVFLQCRDMDASLKERLDKYSHAVREIIPPVDHGDEPTCGPGPFSMAGADTVSAQLLAAGFSAVGFERFDTDICIGQDLEEALAFAKALGPAGEMLRLAAARGIDEAVRVDAALRDALAPFLTPKGVYAPSSTWFVTARSS